jgi:uncharacterized protein
MKVFGIAALLLAAAAIAGVAQPHWGRAAAQDTGGTITVSGTGTATTVPDRASFDFTVETRAKTAGEALAQNSAEARAVIAAVMGDGVAAADVQTAELSLSPTTSQNGVTIVGYSASNTITVRVRNLTGAGRIVDAAVAAGATGVSGPSLFGGDQSGLYREALKAAVAEAHAKAQALAEAAGVSLGRVTAIVEGGGATPVPFSGKADAAPSVPIMPGTQEISATVSVTFAAG